MTQDEEIEMYSSKVGRGVELASINTAPPGKPTTKKDVIVYKGAMLDATRMKANIKRELI